MYKLFHFHAVDPRRFIPGERNDKALLPLAAAKVEVIADEENPGYYVGKFFLRPHFQLEGMDIGMSLVSKLPGAK